MIIVYMEGKVLAPVLNRSTGNMERRGHLEQVLKVEYYVDSGLSEREARQACMQKAKKQYPDAYWSVEQVLYVNDGE